MFISLRTGGYSEDLKYPRKNPKLVSNNLWISMFHLTLDIYLKNYLHFYVTGDDAIKIYK